MGLETELLTLAEGGDLSDEDFVAILKRFVLKKCLDTPEDVSLQQIGQLFAGMARWSEASGGGGDDALEQLRKWLGDSGDEQSTALPAKGKSDLIPDSSGS